MFDQQTNAALRAFLEGLQRTGAGPGVGLRHDIGDPTTSPDPAYLFAPHGSDSARVYWNEAMKPLAMWLPLEASDAMEETVEFLGYLVAGQTADDPGVQDDTSACANCGQPSCSAISGGICDSFGKTADLGPVIRYNAHKGQILTSSVTYDWTKIKARQNRGAPKSISLISAIDGRNIVLTDKMQIWAYLANYQWFKEFSWSLWGGHGYNGSFPGLLEVVRPGWAKENEYRRDGTGIPDNVYMDPKTIGMGGVPYYDHPWIIAERVQQVVNELKSRGTPPRTATIGGVPNVLVDFAFVAAPEWMPSFAKIAARVGMLNEFGQMPSGFSFNVTTNEAEARFLGMTQGALGYGYIATPSGNVPFLPEDFCDPAKIPAEGCQRSADECDTSDTYSTTARLLVRKAGAENALAIQYLDYRQTAEVPEGVGSDIVMGDSGRWLTGYPRSTTGFCERAVQVGNLGMVNRAPTLQTIFTGMTFRSYLEPERYTVGSTWFKGGPPDTIKTVSTATRDLTLTNLDGDLYITGTATTVAGGNGVYTITSADLDSLDVVPVGTLFTSGNYIGHVTHYSDATNTITVIGDLSGVPSGSAFSLGVDTDCEDCPSTATTTVVTEEPCEVVRATYTGTLVTATAGRSLTVDSAVMEALADHALVGGYIYVAGALVGRIVSFLTPSTTADFVLAEASNVPLAPGDTVTVYFDTGCESDDASVEQITAFVTVPQVPVTGTDTVYIGFVSKTGATTSISPVSGYPAPDDTYIDLGTEVAMLATLTAQDASSGGVVKWVDVQYESDQVAGVFATVRVPYSKA